MQRHEQPVSDAELEHVVGGAGAANPATGFVSGIVGELSSAFTTAGKVPLVGIGLGFVGNVLNSIAQALP